MRLSDSGSIMAADAGLASSRFSVRKLPVLGRVVETLVLPFKHLPVVARYGWIPLAGSLIAYLLDRLVSNHFPTLSYEWLAISHFILFTPFSVLWTRIAIYGEK